MRRDHQTVGEVARKRPFPERSTRAQGPNGPAGQQATRRQPAAKPVAWLAMSGREWWREGVIYQAYPRSFQDSNGDGVGDLQGVIDRLDYLQWLGVDAIWLNPITVSPDADVGYDVADYCAVQPVFGDLGMVDRLIAEAGKRDIKIVLDIGPN